MPNQNELKIEDIAEGCVCIVNREPTLALKLPGQSHMSLLQRCGPESIIVMKDSNGDYPLSPITEKPNGSGYRFTGTYTRFYSTNTDMHSAPMGYYHLDGLLRKYKL